METNKEGNGAMKNGSFLRLLHLLTPNILTNYHVFWHTLLDPKYSLRNFITYHEFLKRFYFSQFVISFLSYGPARLKYNKAFMNIHKSSAIFHYTSHINGFNTNSLSSFSPTSKIPSAL